MGGKNSADVLNPKIEQWFTSRKWKTFPFQREVWAAYANAEFGLLHCTTGAGIFRDRFAGMTWSILTPDHCAHWDGRQLSFTASGTEIGGADERLHRESVAHLLRQYFQPCAHQDPRDGGQMPKKYWKNLPEAAAIPTLLQEASAASKK